MIKFEDLPENDKKLKILYSALSFVHTRYIKLKDDYDNALERAELQSMIEWITMRMPSDRVKSYAE